MRGASCQGEQGGGRAGPDRAPPGNRLDWGRGHSSRAGTPTRLGLAPLSSLTAAAVGPARPGGGRRGLSEPPASGSTEQPGQVRSAFPSYEELSADLIEALDQAGLFIEDVRHHLEPSVGERRFECTIRLSSNEPPSRYHVHLSFVWDALLTYIAAYGAGADCDLYHDDDESEDCPHHQLPPQPFVELEAEFVLGDGGYELHDVAEISSWVETVQELLAKVFRDEDRPSSTSGSPPSDRPLWSRSSPPSTRGSSTSSSLRTSKGSPARS